jgi:hypothetical protein
MTTLGIPFINSVDDWSLAQQIFPDCEIYRVTMQSKSYAGSASGDQGKLWVDTEADALHNWPKSNNHDFNTYFNGIEESKTIADAAFMQKPEKAIVAKFVSSILDPVITKLPHVGWLSVPQLAHVDGAERNKINRSLAEAAQQWKLRKNFKGKFILPAIFTRQNQLNNKTQRNAKVSLVSAAFQASGSEGLWVVDSSLHDQEGTGSFMKRFKGIIGLHEELNKKITARALTVAGPYWALGLILWGRKLITQPALGIGRGFQYYIQGGAVPKAANARIALPPLRRQAVWSSNLKTWIENSLQKMPTSDPAFAQFSDILKQFPSLKDKKTARRQVAEFYCAWLKKFESVPPDGRSMALYQDFSSAYVLGKTLSDVPDKPKSPYRIAEQFMMVSL